MNNLTIKAADGTTDVVFTAISAQGQNTDPARWANKKSSAMASDKLDMLVRYPTGNQTTERIKLKLDLPNIVDVAGIPTSAYITPYAAVEFVFDQRVPVAQRTELRKRIANLLNNATVVAAIDSGNPAI